MKIKSNDPKVIEFVKFLGCDIGGLHKIIITIEEMKTVIIEETRDADNGIKESAFAEFEKSLAKERNNCSCITGVKIPRELYENICKETERIIIPDWNLAKTENKIYGIPFLVYDGKEIIFTH